MVDPLEGYDFLLLDLDSLPDTTADADEDEEEDLEWLSNKDAFPSLDTSSFLSPSPSLFPSSSHVLIPAKPRTKGGRRKRRDFRWFSAAAAATPEERKKEQRKKCTHCEAEETPQWRAGPDGPRTLCNACGVRYKSGRLVPEYRPASSPSFSPAIHSNSHRRILEMRRRRRGDVSKL